MDIIQEAHLLENNLKKLLDNYNFLKNENELMYKKVAALEEKLHLEKSRFNKLSEDHNLLKMAKTIEGGIESTKETKLKINTLIREIDTCIDQLSK